MVIAPSSSSLEEEKSIRHAALGEYGLRGKKKGKGEKEGKMARHVPENEHD